MSGMYLTNDDLEGYREKHARTHIKKGLDMWQNTGAEGGKGQVSHMPPWIFITCYCFFFFFKVHLLK